MMPRLFSPNMLALLVALGAAAACDSRDNGLGPGQSGTDRTPPTVIATVPADLATQVPRTGPITITFSEAVVPASLTGSITFSPTVAGTVSYTGNTATFTPTAQLAGTTLYTATVSTNVEDPAGNNLVAPFSWTFTTAP
jgi:hypothetical protein